MCIIAIIMKWFHFTLLVLGRLSCTSDVSSSLMCLPLILKHSWWWWCHLAGHLKPNLLDMLDGSYYCSQDNSCHGLWSFHCLQTFVSEHQWAILNLTELWKEGMLSVFVINGSQKFSSGIPAFSHSPKNMRLNGNSKLAVGMSANGRLFQTQKTMIWLCTTEVAILVPVSNCNSC